MLFHEYIRLATRSLRRRRLRSWLTMIGIFIGIAAVVSLISLGEGMQQAITKQFFQLGADKLTIQTKGARTGPPGSNTDIKLTEGDLDVVRRANGVALATARLVEPIRVEYNKKERFLYLSSLPKEAEERAMVLETVNIKKEVAHGRLLKPDDQWKVMMSEEYYNEKKFNGKALRVGDKILIEGRPVDVVGFYKKTGNPLLDNSFLMNEDAMRKLLNLPEKVDIILARAAPGANVSLVAANIEKDLRKYRNVDEGKEDFEVKTAEETLDTFRTILSVVTAVLVGIAAISLLVGGIGIMNTMYTSVLERKREIGVMKAIGAQRRDIITLFLIEAGLLGLTGSSIGVLLGMGLSKIVELAAYHGLGTMLIQAHFPPSLIVGSLVFGFLVGTLAGVFPASQAARLPPVEALRQ